MSNSSIGRSLGKLALAVLLTGAILWLFGSVVPPVEKWQQGPTITISCGLLALALLGTYLAKRRSASASEATTAVMRKIAKSIIVVDCVLIGFVLFVFLISRLSS